MRPILIKLFLPVLFIAFAAIGVHGQTCTGSLGDPIIDETFGAGTSPGFGPALPADVTNYNYVASQCPEDSSYTIGNSTGPTSCYNVWHITTDHTGDPNGYMMIVNGSYQPGVFYTKKVAGNQLCPNTTYEFAAWIANLIIDEPETAGFILPNITFTISTADGRLLAPAYNTGDIPQVPANAANLWNQYGTYFTTPSDGSDLVVTMTNNAPGGSGNDLILDDITFRPCGPLIQTGFGSSTGPVTQSLCAGDNATFTLQASQNGYATPQYQWQLNKDNAGWNDLPGETTGTLLLDKTFMNATVGTYQYRMAISSGSSTSLLCRTYSTPLVVQVNPLPVLTVAATQSACEGDAVQLTAGGDAASYQWSGPNLPPTSQNPVIIPKISLADAGKYTVIATSSSSCPISGSIMLTVYPRVTATISAEATICQGSSTSLASGGGTVFNWTPAIGLSDTTSATPVASPNDTTVYHVKVTDANGCFDTASVKVNVLKKPVANAGGRKAIFEGQSIQLSGTAKGSVATVYWTPANYLDNPASLTPIASPLSNTTYTLHVLSADNCGIDSSSVFIRVYRKITIPNTFSPNNDGHNDYWNIKDLDTYPDCLVTVFNRYGQRVYQSIGYNTPWNGTYNGVALSLGTYYYIIDLKNNIPKISGWLLIVK